MSIEGPQRLRDGSESSDEEGKDSKSKEKMGNKAAESRWLRAPLFSREKLGAMPKTPELPRLRLPLPLEKLTDKEQAGEQKPEAATTEVAEGAVPVTSGFEQATEDAAELRDIPHFSEERPFSSTIGTAEGDVSTEPQGVESGPPAAETPPLEPWQSISGDSPFSRGWENGAGNTDAIGRAQSRSWQSEAALTAASAPTFEASPSLDPIPEASPKAGPSSTPETVTSTGVTAVIDALKAAKELAEMASDPLPMIARTLTQLAVAGYLAGRKDVRYTGLKQQLQQYDQRFNQIQQQHQQTGEQLTSHLVQAEGTPQASQPERVVIDQEGNEITLRPGWRVERSAGGYSVVVDEHGRTVHNAIKYGEAFKREQQREQLSDDLFNAISGGSTIGASSADDTDYYDTPRPAQVHTQIPDMSGAQPTPPETVDIRHRLPKPHNHLAETLISPWLWTAVAILIIIYFIASLA